MDGHFVPNITIGPPVVKCLRKTTRLILDAHLMITRPLQYLDAFLDAGADHITFHVESEGEPMEIVERLRRRNGSVGITLKPATPAEAVLPFLEVVDMVLVMTVEPGFGGQRFMTDMMPKIRKIRREITRRNLSVHIQVDGGIDAQTVATVAMAGANVFVAGTSVFRNPLGADRAIAELRAAQPLFCDDPPER
jgi:ribulose-phosphate 3-epimerase